MFSEIYQIRQGVCRNSSSDSGVGTVTIIASTGAAGDDGRGAGGGGGVVLCV